MLHWIFAAQSTTSSSNPFQSVLDFFDSPAWHFVLLMSYFVLVVIWIAGAYWIFKDARRRIDDKIVIAVCVLAGVVFGPIGWIVYAIARPPEYLADRRERELDMQMLEQQLSMDSRCSFCKTPVRDDYLVCPTCARRLRTSCPRCSRPIEPQWRVCPYCESDVSHAPAAVYERV
ncbi:MAG: zinc ribbon domain-containing protein [Thermoleophilia bacterium]